MKVYFTLAVLLLFCLCAFKSYKENGIQEHNVSSTLQMAINNIPKKDSLPKNSIQINGKNNVVTIDTIVKAAQGEKTTTHTININGEGNTVKIHQAGQNGNVNIQQNGNGNHVNVKQSESKD